MLLGGIVVAVVGVVPASVAQAFNRAVCVVTTEECPGGTPRDRVPGLAKTEAEVAPESRAFAQSQAQHRAEQPTLREDVRRRVVDAGNGTGGTRSSRTNMPLPEDTPRQVRTMLSASPEKFSQLVQRKAIYSDAPGWFGVSQYNWRYFRSDPGAGDGIVVFDFFIETGTSGHIIRGDDRGFPEDSGALSVPMHMSRFRVVIDRSTGRGVIIQSKSTGNDWLHGILQNEPQPIAINEDGTIKNYQLPNHYKVHADENSITLEYKGVNSITRGPDVRGTIKIRRDERGNWEVVRRSGDNYPAIGVYYRDRSGHVQPILEHHQQNPPICGATALDCDTTPLPTYVPRHPPTPPDDSSATPSPSQTPVTVPTG